MLNKDLIIENFSKSLETYDKNAVVQKEMAEFLFSKITGNKYNSILEIGSYSGNLTKLIVNNIEFNDYLAIDIIDSFDYIKNLSPKINFKKIDIQNFKTNQKFDLIVSNATLQWVDDFYSIFSKLKSYLNQNGLLVISIFGKDNLIEIKEAFNIGLNYPTVDYLKTKFPDCIFYSNIHKLNFKNSIDILKHLKYTGVNSIQKNKLSYSEIKKCLKILETKYNNTITYNPIYIIFQHS